MVQAIAAKRDKIISTLFQELTENNEFFDGLSSMLRIEVKVRGKNGNYEIHPKYRKGQHPDSKEARRSFHKKRTIYETDDEDDSKEARCSFHKKRTIYETDEDSDPEVSNEVKEENDIESSSISGIEDLRVKFRNKFAQLRPDKVPSANGKSNESKRAKRRAEKKRRIEAAKARKKSPNNSASLSRAASTRVTLDSNIEKEQPVPTLKDDLSKMDFGKIDGLNSKPYYLDNKSLRNNNGKKKKNLHKLLREAEAKKEKITELMAGDENDKMKAKKMQWVDTLKKASGDKANRSPAQIKKKMKQKEKKKAKSTKEWNARLEQQDRAKQEKQKIRAHNIQKRKLGGSVGANLSKKRIVDDSDITDTKTKKKKDGDHVEK